MESFARKKFEELMNVKVKEAGLFIDSENGFLGATPDGLLGNDTILEMKCLHKVAKLGISLEEATKKKHMFGTFWGPIKTEEKSLLLLSNSGTTQHLQKEQMPFRCIR